MRTLLNRGLSFVPVPGEVNKSGLIADISRYERSMKWRDYFFEEEPHESDGEIGNEEDTQPRDIFKQKKFNLPPTKAHPGLSDYLSAVKSDIMGSCNNKKVHQISPKKNWKH